MSEYMTSQEVCKELGITPQTLCRKVRQKVLKKYKDKINLRSVYFKREEVEKVSRKVKA